MSHAIHVRLKRNGIWYEHSEDSAKKTAIAALFDLNKTVEAGHALKKPRRLWEDRFSLFSL